MAISDEVACDKSRHVISKLYSADAKFITKIDKDDGDIEEKENLEDFSEPFHLVMMVKIY